MLSARDTAIVLKSNIVLDVCAFPTPVSHRSGLFFFFGVYSSPRVASGAGDVPPPLSSAFPCMSERLRCIDLHTWSRPESRCALDWPSSMKSNLVGVIAALNAVLTDRSREMTCAPGIRVTGWCVALSVSRLSGYRGRSRVFYIASQRRANSKPLPSSREIAPKYPNVLV
ncbi:hypothetical protein BC828DRAFT_260587 [Blastocladiella britannica]|nr:hypothetical protein BC828DRAFT_260587 [Blastocladiella britannica]